MTRTCLELLTSERCESRVAFGCPVVPDVNCKFVPLNGDMSVCSAFIATMFFLLASVSTSLSRRVPLFKKLTRYLYFLLNEKTNFQKKKNIFSNELTVRDGNIRE